ncbi:XRE family transcriptional regulator [Streptomyces xinghaiensis]|uniref:XRE family transcriptional regulator n=2 Tax=Streptomyces TaxID=1883 RepID=A0A3M8F6M1_9ACTN|nr:hypothetical protein [Streptomyces xinghaiensis]OFA56717.1 hypothetical protein BEN35_05730 [Streptomyces fradiae]PQM22827.1 hypothetical protein Sfr7A_14090 [Streptomyces xinghaiensis]RKM97997.1 XRE family transcriptional regulator [Streptomyces xinghaiensis]RNC73865.1 XRE family transcriptional regulator [Streptomyces xinghaiensis]
MRERAAEEGWTVHETAQAIREHCGLSRLRANRLARGLTLSQAGGELRELAHRMSPIGPKADEDQLRLWETGARTPRAGAVALLCRYYEATPYELGLGYADGAADDDAHPPRRMARTRSSFSGTAVEREPLFRDIDATRRSVDRALAAGTVAPGQMDLLEEQLLLVRYEYVFTPPARMMNKLLRILREVRGLLEDRQPTSVTVRLTEITAVASTLIADALMKFGAIDDARAWYATARHASDESGNAELRARVRIQAAMLGYYYGPVQSAVTLTREARIMSRGKPSPTAAFAVAAEARALAFQGNRSEAATRVKNARGVFDQLAPRSDDDAFAFPLRRFLLYLSGTFTALGQVSEARKVQEEALSLYPARTGIDPALLRLEAAICLAHDRSATEACQLATAAYLQVPEEHRTAILGARARHVIDRLPGTSRRIAAARELGELLQLPGSHL